MKTKSGMTVTRRLKAMPYADAGILEGDGSTNLIEALISYQTIVGVIYNDEKLGTVLAVCGLFSATTRKHLSAWMRQCGLSYDVAKNCVEQRKVYSFAEKKLVDLQ